MYSSPRIAARSDAKDRESVAVARRELCRLRFARWRRRATAPPEGCATSGPVRFHVLRPVRIVRGGRCPTSICCSAVQFFGGALRASYFVPRSRNAGSLGIPANKSGVREREGTRVLPQASRGWPDVRRPVPIVTLVATTTLALAACEASSGADDAPPAVVERPAGVARASEVLRIDGHAESLTPIAAVRAADHVALSGDRLYLAQRQDAGVVVYDTLGARQAFLGGRGQGPGEFSNISRVEVTASGDLWVMDTRLGRATWFPAEDPSAPRTEPMPQSMTVPESVALGVSTIAFPIIQYPLGTDGLLATLLPSVPELDAMPDSLKYTRILGRVSADGRVERIVFVAPGNPTSLVGSDGSVRSLPFPNGPETDVSPDGSSVAWAYGWIDGARAGEIEVRHFRADGTERFRSVLDVPLQPVPDSAAARLRGDLPVPDYLPPVDALVIGTDETLWVGHSRSGGNRAYTVLSPGGEMVGVLELPVNQRLAIAHTNRVWVVERDELGVESLVKLTVEW